MNSHISFQKGLYFNNFAFYHVSIACTCLQEGLEVGILGGSNYNILWKHKNICRPS